MNILNEIVLNGDILQVVGEIKLSSGGIPILTNKNELCYVDDSIKVDVTPLFHLSQDSSKCVLKSKDTRVIFYLSFKDGLLDGLCRVLICNTLACEGIWKKGVRMGPFHEYCNGIEVFNGEYVNGVRCGKAVIRTTLTDSPCSVVFHDNSTLYYSLDRYQKRTLCIYYSPSVLQSIMMVTSDQKKDGFVIHYRGEEPKSVEMWKQDHLLYVLKQFSHDIMTCLSEFGCTLYSGQYRSLHPIWFVMHGKGTQFLNGCRYYSGDMRYGKREGYGRLYYQNGLVKYEGKWSDDEPDGEGKMYDADGIVFCSCNCTKGMFRYGFGTYSVYSFAPMNPIFSIFGNSAQGSSYSILNQPSLPSTYFDLTFEKSPFHDIKSSDDLNLSVPSISYSSPFLSALNGMKPLLNSLHLDSYDSIISTSKVHIHSDQQFSTMIKWDLSVLMKLESLIIDDSSMVSQNSFIVKSVPYLKNIQIGNECFYHRRTSYSGDGEFQLIDCPRLITVTIGGDSFAEYCSVMVNSGLLISFSLFRLSPTSSVCHSRFGSMFIQICVQSFSSTPSFPSEGCLWNQFIP